MINVSFLFFFWLTAHALHSPGVSVPERWAFCTRSSTTRVVSIHLIGFILNDLLLSSLFVRSFIRDLLIMLVRHVCFTSFSFSSKKRVTGKCIVEKAITKHVGMFIIFWILSERLCCVCLYITCLQSLCVFFSVFEPSPKKAELIRPDIGPPLFSLCSASSLSLVYDLVSRLSVHSHHSRVVSILVYISPCLAKNIYCDGS